MTVLPIGSVVSAMQDVLAGLGVIRFDIHIYLADGRHGISSLPCHLAVDINAAEGFAVQTMLDYSKLT